MCTHIWRNPYTRDMNHMAQSIKEERLRWVLPLAEGRISWAEVTKVSPHPKRTLERWLAAYRGGGAEALEPRSTRPKTNTKETSYKYLKASRKPGELIEIDVKHVPGHVAGRRYFQYTAIDCATRWRHLAVYPEEATSRSIDFLKEVIARFPYPIPGVKTDNHSTFTNRYLGTNRRSGMTVKTLHALDRFCASEGITHFLIDPGKPAQNGTVERSHRSDQETLYDRNTFRSLPELKRKLKRWNREYNDLEHCGLNGKT